VLRQKKLPG